MFYNLSGSALFLGDSGGKLRPLKRRRPRNKIFIKKNFLKNLKKAFFFFFFFFAMRRGRGEKKGPITIHKQFCQEKKSTNKSVLFLR